MTMSEEGVWLLCVLMLYRHHIGVYGCVFVCALCMYVCMHFICPFYVFMCMHTNVSVYVYLIYKCVCVYVYMCARVYVCVCVYVCMCARVHVYVCTCAVHGCMTVE